ncbi:hypothetical protein [Rhodococcus artemisiae]|uniref:Uncharacterized protein n=1 Tax=Rhodococcus artemisiae TaxID=714159 RepID=A0ABU7LBN9_9NOCA|nr:hypothetical protein [Rhodococcus artemisiae]MEE2058958.1 hypothetical protein [Rhodococcus artemisiae]
MKLFHLTAWALLAAYFTYGCAAYGLTGSADGWFVALGWIIPWPAVISIGMAFGRRP